jgi:WD40 repeat protein
VSYLGGVSLVRGVSGSADAATNHLDGVEDVTSLLFLRDGRGLLGIRDDRVLYWDITQTSSVPSETYEVPLPGGCAACSAPKVYVSPDESQIAALAGSGDAAALVDLGAGDISEATDAEYGFRYAQPTWTDDARAVFPVIAPLGGSAPGLMPEQVGDMISWERPTGDRDSLAMGTTRDERVASIDAQGTIRVQDAVTGEVMAERVLTGSKEITYSDAQFRPGDDALVVIQHDTSSPDVVHVLVLDVALADEAPTVIATGAYERVAWQQDKLLVQDAKGVIEVRSSSDGALLRSFNAADGALVAADSSGTTSFAAIMRDDKSIDLIDTRAGTVVTTFASRTGSLYDRSTIVFMPLTGRVVIIEEPTGYPSSAARLTIYNLTAGSIVDAACRIAWTRIVPDRWDEFAPSIAAPTGLCS